jgi:hypothetical protein
MRVLDACRGVACRWLIMACRSREERGGVPGREEEGVGAKRRRKHAVMLVLLSRAYIGFWRITLFGGVVGAIRPATA